MEEPRIAADVAPAAPSPELNAAAGADAGGDALRSEHSQNGPLSDAAEGALAGLHVGEVLGVLGEGVRRDDAIAAVQGAFPDFATAGAAVRRAAALARGCPQRGTESLDAATGGIPGWVPVAVGTGVAHDCDPVEDLARAVGSRLAPSHHDRLTHACAASVAVAVSAAVAGCDWAQCLSLAISAADGVEQEWLANTRPWTAGPSVGARLAWAHALATRASEDPMAIIDLLVGTSSSPQECVPAAFAVVGRLAWNAAEAEPSDGSVASVTRVARRIDPVEAARQAAMLGGCAPVIATVGGAIAGALAGVEAVPSHMRPSPVAQG